LYHIRPDCFKPYKDLTSFTQYMLRFAFIFGTEIPSKTFMYMSESNDPYKYTVMISINYKDRCFCITRDIKHYNIILLITGEYISLKSTSGLCVKPCATSLTLYLTTSLFLFLLQTKISFEPNRKGSRRCRYYFCKHLSFLKRVKLSFNCFFPLVLV
jgi:hypothetical protein